MQVCSAKGKMYMYIGLGLGLETEAETIATASNLPWSSGVFFSDVQLCCLDCLPLLPSQAQATDSVTDIRDYSVTDTCIRDYSVTDSQIYRLQCHRYMYQGLQCH